MRTISLGLPFRKSFLKMFTKYVYTLLISKYFNFLFLLFWQPVYVISFYLKLNKYIYALWYLPMTFLSKRSHAIGRSCLLAKIMHRTEAFQAADNQSKEEIWKKKEATFYNIFFVEYFD